MKILLTVDPNIPVPPIYYGGIERIVDLLAREYSSLGHNVILAAHSESTCTGAIRRYGWKGKSASSWRDTYKNTFNLRHIYQKENPDIIHSFSRLLYLYPLFLKRHPLIVQTYQRRITPFSVRYASLLAGRQLHFTACATHLYRGMESTQSSWHTVFNFTDTSYFTPAKSPKQDYLLFLGRLEPIKGVHDAIEVAQRSGMRLIIAGNIPVGKEEYFQNEIKPKLNTHIQYVGAVNDIQKLDLLRHAAALVFPIHWEEPFGIVMAESLACGTPVLAYPRGSVTEVLKEGETGFLCKSVEEMTKKVVKIDILDRNICRRDAEERFSATVVAQQYLRLFELIRNV